MTLPPAVNQSTEPAFRACVTHERMCRSGGLWGTHFLMSGVYLSTAKRRQVARSMKPSSS